ncbi:ion channel [Ancylobacter sp. TS-1]|uniref:ion channel n=1 Tax=Ancylobacter sp. TS-1 TaxID=1850374 RepID=UPI001265C48E|nr:ion channel [Ancylobacter sp. TS-1]QFR33250.1 two pore domain potassium channel family protein [Ancylobacter sp. TS-1]
MIFEEIAIGIAMMLLVMLVHLMATYILIDFSDAYDQILKHHPRLRLLLALIVANVLLLTAHLIEVGIWAVVYAAKGLVTHHTDAYYSAFVNYTALGYGDSLQQTATRLIGPMTAGSGIMMFGWTTALLFLVIQQHLPEVRRPRRPRAPRPQAHGEAAQEATGGDSSPSVRS